MVSEVEDPVELTAIEFSVEFDYTNNYSGSLQQVLKLLKKEDPVEKYVIELATKNMLLFFKCYLEGVLAGKYILPSEKVTAEAKEVVEYEISIIEEILKY